MISFDFAYYKPGSLQEAVELYAHLQRQGKKPLYYAGGTEIITFARLDQIETDAVIDIKGIPEMHVCQRHQDHLAFGAAVPLTKLEEANLFPLLRRCAGRVADHTTRNSVTLGGNICGQIFYREAVLPFLLTESVFVTAGTNGVRHLPVQQAFRGQIVLEPGELLVQVLTDARDAALPSFHVKKTKLEEIDYPLVTVAALIKGDRVCVALSGLCAFPFRAWEMEEALNQPSVPWEQRIYQAMRSLPGPILHDIRGSAEYRAFVLQHALREAFEALEGVQV